MAKLYTIATPSLLEVVANKIRYRSNMRALASSPSLDSTQLKILEDLRRDGCAIVPNIISASMLNSLKLDLQNALEELKFADTPYLDPSKIDPVKHPPLKKIMLLSPEELRKMGLAIDRADFHSYQQVIDDFSPAELAVHMLEYSEVFRNLWLNPYLLSIVSHYMGLVPQLVEAYVRRSFPSPHRIANNFWHRDCIDNKTYLLKIFFFLTDCTSETGPHEYIRGSCTEKNKLKILNGKRFYEDAELDAAYPETSEDRIVSIVPAGTIVIEDTRGLHRAHILTSGYRDLGYAVFKPAPKNMPPYYKLPSSSCEKLTPFQKLFVPEQCFI